jgi:hypothetical protein
LQSHTQWLLGSDCQHFGVTSVADVEHDLERLTATAAQNRRKSEQCRRPTHNSTIACAWVNGPAFSSRAVRVEIQLGPILAAGRDPRALLDGAEKTRSGVAGP